MTKRRARGDAPRSDRDQVVDLVKDVLSARGYAVRDVEKLMGRGRGYVGDALRGPETGKKLTVELVLELLAAVGASPGEVFKLAPPRLGQAAEVAEGGAGRPAALPATMRASEPLVQALVLELAEKGVVSIDHLHARQRELAGLPPEESPPSTPRR